MLWGFAPTPKSSRAGGFCCGIPNISDQIKVAENIQDLSGLVNAVQGLGVKRWRTQGRSLPWVTDMLPALLPCNPAGVEGSRPFGGHKAFCSRTLPLTVCTNFLGILGASEREQPGSHLCEVLPSPCQG